MDALFSLLLHVIATFGLTFDLPHWLINNVIYYYLKSEKCIKLVCHLL